MKCEIALVEPVDVVIVDILPVPEIGTFVGVTSQSLSAWIAASSKLICSVPACCVPLHPGRMTRVWLIGIVEVFHISLDVVEDTCFDQTQRRADGL